MRTKKFLLIITINFLVLFFQNFTLSNLNNKKYSFDEKARIDHAREILGKSYKKSPAYKIKGDKYLHVYLYSIVKDRLPKKFKHKSTSITKTIISEAKKYEIDPIFLTSIIMTESSFDPLAKGTSGEIGLMQLMPRTGESVASTLNIKWHGKNTLKDPVKNIKIGSAYINQLREFFGKNPSRYISAYNSGPGTILKIENKKDLPKIYSGKIIHQYNKLYKKLSSLKIPNDVATDNI